MHRDEIAIIVPTLNRVNYVKRLLESINRQGVLPQELIIVDGGSSDISSSLKDFKDINIKYIISKPPSLTKQRNIGILNISDPINLVAFVDDDVVLENDSLKNMLKFWEAAGPEIGGASFNNISDSFRKANIIEYIFFVNCSQGGKIMKSGFNSQISSIEDTKCVDWLFGGITVWRRRVVEEFKFDEWFTANAYCDDIDYSYRVGRKYKLMVVKEAKVSHLPAPIDFNKEYDLVKKQVVNRLYFVKKYQGFSFVLCCWSYTGLFLKNLFLGTVRCKPRYLLRGMGIFTGIIASFLMTNELKKINPNILTH